MKLVLVLFIVMPLYVSSQDVRIKLDNELNLRVNEVMFRPGLISLNSFSKAVNEKYKVKRIRSPYVRYYNYVFKKLGVTLQSSDFEKPSNKCRALIICFRKKRKQKFNGHFEIFDQKIDWQTKFDDIYYNNRFTNFIDYTMYKDKDKPRKTWIHLRFKRHSIQMKFDESSQKIIKADIYTFLLDPNYRDIFSL